MPVKISSKNYICCRYFQAMVVLLIILSSCMAMELESEYRQKFNNCSQKQCILHVTYQDNFNCLASKCTAKEITGKQITCKQFSQIMEDCFSSCENTQTTGLLSCNQSCLAQECSSETDSSDSSFDWTILVISISVVGGIILVFGLLVKLAIRRKMAKLLQQKLAQEKMKSSNQLPPRSYLQQQGQQQVVLSTQDPLATPGIGIQGIPCFDNIGQGDYENVLLGVNLEEDDDRKKQKKQSGKYGRRKPNNILRYMSQGENIVGTVIEETAEGNGQQNDKTLPIDEVQIDHITPNTLVASNKLTDELIQKTRSSPKKGQVEPAILINFNTNKDQKQLNKVDNIQNNHNEEDLNDNNFLRIDIRDHKRKSYISQHSNRHSGTSISNFFGSKNSNRQTTQKTPIYSRGETYVSFDFRDDMIFSKGTTSRKEILFSQNNLELQQVPQKKRLTMMQLPTVGKAENQISKPEIKTLKQRRRKSLDGV